MKLTLAKIYDIPDGNFCNGCACFSAERGGFDDRPAECLMFGVNSYEHKFGESEMIRGEHKVFKYGCCVLAKEGDLYLHESGKVSCIRS